MPAAHSRPRPRIGDPYPRAARWSGTSPKPMLAGEGQADSPVGIVFANAVTRDDHEIPLRNVAIRAVAAAAAEGAASAGAPTAG
jgi:hypothetical protein